MGEEKMTNDMVRVSRFFSERMPNGMTWHYIDADYVPDVLLTKTDGDTKPRGGFFYSRLNHHQDSGRPGTRRVLTFESTEWSDYSGAGYNRANYEALLRDFPGVFLKVDGHHGSRGLALRSDDLIPQHLAATMRDLADDYPLYDDEALSELELSMADEAWDQFLRMDTEREIEAVLPSEDARPDVARYWARDSAAVRWQLDEEWLCERFYELTSEKPESPYLESATSIVFPYAIDDAKELAAEIVAKVDALVREEEAEAWTCELAVSPGQGELF